MPEKKKRPYAPPRYKRGDKIYLWAFLKKYKGNFFMCRATIDECPKPNTRRVYKVKITAVSEAAIGSKETPAQATLLGRIITKRENEISKVVPGFLIPKSWIEAAPDGKAKGKGQEG